jgi:uncharacterized protein involved in exopolysaccharide biosynthesis
VLSGLPGDLETIQSETEIIKSRSLADKVVRKLKLYDDPEFNPRLRPETFLDSAASVVGDWAGSVFPGPEKQAVPLEDQFDMERVGIIDNFAEKLEVGRRGRSRVIEIAFESEEPRTAVLVANTIADLYLLEQLEAKFEMTQRATLWLHDRMSELRKEVKASELAVEVFRAKAGLVEGEHASLAAQQISELSTQLVLARSARAEADARLRQVRSLLNSANGVDSVAEVLSSPLIQRLREQEAEVERKIAELLTEYGDKHPRMINIRAEMRDLRAKITSEVNKIVQNLRGEVSVVRARENSLQSSLDKLKQRVGSLNSSEVQLRALQREANANRDLSKRAVFSEETPDLRAGLCWIGFPGCRSGLRDRTTRPWFPQHGADRKYNRHSVDRHGAGGGEIQGQAREICCRESNFNTRRGDPNDIHVACPVKRRRATQGDSGYLGAIRRRKIDDCGASGQDVRPFGQALDYHRCRSASAAAALETACTEGAGPCRLPGGKGHARRGRPEGQGDR